MPSTDRMDLQQADAYGRSFADVYDRWYRDVTDESATARFVAELCGKGPVYEFGVGSGRIATPLAQAGVMVVGLDGSRAMLQGFGRATTSTSTAAAPVLLVEADMRALPFRQASKQNRATGVLITFNTIYNLCDEAEQHQLIFDIADLLGSNGVLIVEALDVSSLADGPDHSLGVGQRSQTDLVVSATQVEHKSQTVIGQHIEIGNDGLSTRPWMIRWLTTEQLDRLATEAGFCLERRCRDWEGRTFRPGDETHISVYRLSGRC